MKQSPKNKIIVVIGPTATNKTNIGIELAKTFNGEIINADAFQVYKELNIGVNKPTDKELQEVKFHLVNNISISDKWDIKRFQSEATIIIQDIYKRGKLPIIVGGSHLYVDTLIKNYDLDKSKERDERFINLSVKELQEKLNKYDSALVAKIGNNHKRLIRALQNAVDGHKMNQVNSSIYKPLYVVCTKPREKLYQDINARVDKMIRNGWFEEVHKIINNFPNYGKFNAFKAIGYLDIAKGLITPTLGIDINKIKQRTRQYAKRQLTWIRHHYVNVCEYNQNNLNDIILQVKDWLIK